MKQLEILLPSYNRPEFLKRCIASIDTNSYRNWDIKLSVNVRQKPENWATVMGDAFKNATGDVVMWLSDHNIVHPNCMKSLIDYYEDVDTEITYAQGIAQSNIPQHFYNDKYNGIPMIFMCYQAIPSKWLSAFPERNPIYPEYFHCCCDNELGMFFINMGKFYPNYEAKIDVQHLFSHGQKAVDETFKQGRQKYYNYDRDLFTKRKQRGLIWGESFELIYNEPEPWNKYFIA